MIAQQESWGGNSRKVHHIRDGAAVCGRVPQTFEATVFDCYSVEDAQIRPAQYCKWCLGWWIDRDRCRNGHLRTPETTFQERKAGKVWVACRLCQRAKGAQKRQRRRELKPPRPLGRYAREQAVVRAAVQWRKTNQPDTETHLCLVQAVDALQTYRDAELPT